MLSRMSATLLERPVYGMRQVDVLLGLRGGTARRWIDGYNRRNQHYEPVIRKHTTGAEVVTWGEFVEARLLASYRESNIPMRKMRPVVERLRTELATPYPLAAARLWLYPEGGELVRRVQQEVGLERALHMVEVLRTGQLAYASQPDMNDASSTSSVSFTTPIREFLSHVDFDHDFASRVYPMGKESAVAFDPVRAFGSPAVGTVRTDVIAEEFRSGEPVASIADGFGLTVTEVRDAISYEQRLQAA